MIVALESCAGSSERRDPRLGGCRQARRQPPSLVRGLGNLRLPRARRMTQRDSLLESVSNMTAVDVEVVLTLAETKRVHYDKGYAEIVRENARLLCFIHMTAQQEWMTIPPHISLL
jgi:hypothetical protein